MMVQITRVLMEPRDAPVVLASLGPYTLEPSRAGLVSALTLGTPRKVRQRMARRHRCITERVES